MQRKSGWHRDYRKARAEREDGYVLELREGVWWEGGIVPLMALPNLPLDMDDAIEKADRKRSPDPWHFTSGTWATAGWLVEAVRETGDGDPHSSATLKPAFLGWRVLRAAADSSDVKQATKRLFATSDRARQWAEIRMDRLSGGLRGPKPRAGETSSANLPDVRVTETERVAALDLAGKLGLSFAELSRISLDLVRLSILQEKTYYIGKLQTEKDYRVFHEADLEWGEGGKVFVTQEGERVRINLVGEGA